MSHSTLVWRVVIWVQCVSDCAHSKLWSLLPAWVLWLRCFLNLPGKLLLNLFAHLVQGCCTNFWLLWATLGVVESSPAAHLSSRYLIWNLKPHSNSFILMKHFRILLFQKEKEFVALLWVEVESHDCPKAEYSAGMLECCVALGRKLSGFSIWCIFLEMFVDPKS